MALLVAVVVAVVLATSPIGDPSATVRGDVGVLDVGPAATPRAAPPPPVPTTCVEPHRWCVPLAHKGRDLLVGDDTAYAVTTQGVAAVDVATGSVRWQRDLGTFGPGTRGTWAPAPPGGDGLDLLLVRGSGMGAFALEAATGAVRWSLPGFAQVVASGDVLVSGEDDGSLVGRDRVTGVRRWGVADVASRFVEPAADGVDVVTSDGETVALVATADGAVRWRVPLELSGRRPTLALGPDVVVVGGYGTLQALDRTSGARLWEVEIEVGPSDLVVDRGEVLVTARDRGLVLGARDGVVQREVLAAEGPGPLLVTATPSGRTWSTVTWARVEPDTEPPAEVSLGFQRTRAWLAGDDLVSLHVATVSAVPWREAGLLRGVFAPGPADERR